MKTEKTQKNKINQRIKQSNEIKKKRIRQSKKIKNVLTLFKVFYQNVRGLKSKVDSTMEIISDYQPILICLVETHLQKYEEIMIPGYSQIFRNYTSGNSRGIILAVEENIRTVKRLLRKKKLDKVCGCCSIIIEVRIEQELYMPHKKM